MTAIAPNYADVRNSARRNMLLTALLRCGSEQAPVTIRNMSALGALIDGPIAPVPDSRIELVRGRYVACARVVWSEATRCGIRFLSELSVSEWLAPIDNQPRGTKVAVSAWPDAGRQSAGSTDTKVSIDLGDLLEIADLIKRTSRVLSADPDFLAERMTEARNLVRATHMLAKLCDSVVPPIASSCRRAND